MGNINECQFNSNILPLRKRFIRKGNLDAADNLR